VTSDYLGVYSGFITRAVLFGGTGVLSANRHQQICDRIGEPGICYVRGPTDRIVPDA